jgi:endonuclease YncB( thermonuclease family)
MLLAHAQTFTGPARVVDGDTLAIGGERIRLQGIGAPEIDQVCLDDKGLLWRCGIVACDRLIQHIGARPTFCLTSGKDIYGRWLATCTVDGDLGAWLVAEGLALAFVRYSHAYVADEAVARNARKGLWAGAFVVPWDWRWRIADAVILGATRPTQDQERTVRPAADRDPPWWRARRSLNVRIDGR